MERLEVCGLTVEFASAGYLVRPLEDLWVGARSGELVLLLGPSGCGKTTLISCLAGILTPKEGNILLDGRNITRIPRHRLTEYRRRTCGIVFQGSKLIPSLTARENVEAPLRLAGVPARAARERATDLLRTFDLADRLNHRPARMSGGQQQRVAIARALAHDPPVLLADEPTAQLDYIQVEGVIRTLRDLARPGRIVVVSTHDHRLVPLADRVVNLTNRDAGLHLPRVSQFSLSTGEFLFRQGSRGELVFVVEEGEIELVRFRADGTEEPLQIRGPGDYFGELAPMLGFPRAASARARTAAIVTGHTVAEFRDRIGPEHLRDVLGSREAVTTSFVPA